MTLPEQSDRAVAQTREFLVRLASPYVEGGIKGVRREVRAEALALLKHYPFAWLRDNAAKLDILTDAEREAIKACESDYSDNDMDAACWKIAATLRGLLERLK